MANGHTCLRASLSLCGDVVKALGDLIRHFGVGSASFERFARAAMACLGAVTAGVLLLLAALTAQAAEYSGVASVFELGMGARPLALGGAFTALADDSNALYFNPAGMPWLEGLSMLSSYEQRIGGASYGNLAICLPHVGLGISYLDFGTIPEVDEDGTITGSLTYSSIGLVGSLGAKVANLPLLAELEVADQLGLGLRVKAFIARTVEPASGSGFAIDFPFLFRGEASVFSADVPITYGVGLLLENLVSWPIRYGSGHSEDWPSRVVVGFSVSVEDQIAVAVDLTTDKALRLGAEWAPLPALALRGGVRYEELWMWSLGVGVVVKAFSIDLAYVNHRELGPQLRGSFSMNWQRR